MWIAIITLIILILINAFFAASELALVNVNEAKVKREAESGDKKAQQLDRLISDPSHFLSTIQLGITLAGFLSSAFAADFFAAPLAELLNQLGLPISLSTLNNLSIVVITIILAYFTLVLGELVPKQLALQKADLIAKIAVGPITLLASICLPIIKFLILSIRLVLRIFRVDSKNSAEQTTEEDIRLLVDISGQKGTINKTEQTMIDNVFEFDDKMVSDIMTHRTDVTALSVDLNFDQVIEQINQDRYTRFPVYQGTIDHIIGVLHVKDLFQHVSQKENFDLKKVIRDPYFVLESQPIDRVFAFIREANIHIVMILDEFGGTEGLITIEDIIEEIVGEISSESKEPGYLDQIFTQLTNNQYLVDGTFRLKELSEILNVELSTEEVETVSGLIINQIGYIPKDEERPTIHYQNLVFNVKGIVDNRIGRVLIVDERMKNTDEFE